MVTSLPWPAAQNAAFSAMLRIIPPLAASLASRSMSSSATGAWAGNARSHSLARSAGPGNGNVTMKRSRRRNASSRAWRRLLARIATPR